MLIIRSSAAMARSLDSPMHPTVRRLLETRRNQLEAFGFEDLGEIAQFAIVLPGDSIEDVEREACVPVITNIVDRKRYPDPDYQPNWESCLNHGGICWEATFILSDDGAGVLVIVMNQPGVDPTLLALCRQFATEAPALPDPH